MEHGVLDADTKCYQNNDELIIEMTTHSLQEQQRVMHNIEEYMKTHSPKTLSPDILRIEVSKEIRIFCGPTNSVSSSRHSALYLFRIARRIADTFNFMPRKCSMPQLGRLQA